MARASDPHRPWVFTKHDLVAQEDQSSAVLRAIKNIEHFSGCAQTVAVKTLSRLDNLENVLLAQIQKLRAVRAEMQKHAAAGTK